MADYQIFISYRRDGGEDLAGRISDKLKNLGYRVFYDIESMRSGTFNTQIFSAIDGCDDVLLILPQGALERCKDENDWVRLEIAHALKMKKNIIPVMMRGFAFPEGMPEDIDGIRYHEGVSASTEYFDAMIGKIEKLMNSVLSEAAEAIPENTDLSNGIRFLNYGMYTQACASLEKALSTDISNPDVYFYMAAALLGGKRPFLTPKSVIDKAVEYLNIALTIEEKAVYHYFLAFIKKDHHERKCLKVSPGSGYNSARADALGITEGEIQSLSELLKLGLIL